MLESCTPSTEFRSRCSRWEKPVPIALRRYREYVTNFRAALVPAANIGSNLGPLLVVGGIFLSTMGAISALIINIGIALFLGVIAFHIITLPVEFDASRRALNLIDELGILQGEEHRGAKAVLQAAAWTYVATAFYALLQLAQLLLMASRRR